jgi:hypothetical protein
MRIITVLVTLFIFASQLSIAQTNCDELKKENEYLKKALQINTPAKTVTASKIDFNLIRCEGNVKEQTVNIVMTLVNHDANRGILIDPVRVIDVEGNEYRSDKILVGTQDGSNDLYTDTPLKTVIRIGKVLPAVKMIKMVPLKCYDPAQGHFEIELKDLPVSWK